MEELIARLQRQGHRVYAAGDSNHHLQTFAGLTSAWEGRAAVPTCGRQTLDDVHGPGTAADLRTIATPSDHLAVLVTR